FIVPQLLLPARGFGRTARQDRSSSVAQCDRRSATVAVQEQDIVGAKTPQVHRWDGDAADRYAALGPARVVEHEEVMMRVAERALPGTERHRTFLCRPAKQDSAAVLPVKPPAGQRHAGREYSEERGETDGQMARRAVDERHRVRVVARVVANGDR